MTWLEAVLEVFVVVAVAGVLVTSVTTVVFPITKVVNVYTGLRMVKETGLLKVFFKVVTHLSSSLSMQNVLLALLSHLKASPSPSLQSSSSG